MQRIAFLLLISMLFGCLGCRAVEESKVKVHIACYTPLPLQVDVEVQRSFK